MSTVATLLPLLAVLSGSAAATPDGTSLYARDTYRLQTIVCPFRGRIDYEPGSIRCRLLQVPENREDPESRFIELHVVELPAQPEDDGDDDDAGVRDDPVIYLTGGPGAQAGYYVGRLADHAERRQRSLYILEQRGIAERRGILSALGFAAVVGRPAVPCRGFATGCSASHDAARVFAILRATPRPQRAIP
ncbi:MAG: hypothetical protein AAFX58_10455 [Pseudomonadota bacterium]